VANTQWRVLLLGGASGSGKSTVAERLGLRLGIPWLQVDDFRLALQYSRVSLPENTEALYFLERTSEVWHLSPKRLCDALIAVSEVMAPAIDIVVRNHVDTDAPCLIEGDGILPSLLARSGVRERAKRGLVRAVFLVEPDEDTILSNFAAPARHDPGLAAGDLRTEARAKWLYGQWLRAEAAANDVPVVEPRPWVTLPDRILAAAEE